MKNLTMEIRVIYISKATDLVSPSALESLAEQSAALNVSLNITGVLMQMGNCYFQVLEGGFDDVMHLMQVIQADKRHTDVRLILREPCVHRVFDKWSMACVDLDVSTELDAPLCRELRLHVYRIKQGSKSSAECIAKILKGVPLLLESRSLERSQTNAAA